MKELLFLAHRIPFPPNKGDKLRSYNLLKHLSRDYRVHLGAFIDDEQDWRYVEEVKSMCGECHFVGLNSRSAKLRSLPALLGSRPLSVPYYYDASMAEWVRNIMDTQPVHHVLTFSGPMAQYVAQARGSALRRVMDFVDIDSDKWRQYADSRRWPMSWIYRREARTLLRYERRIAADFDASVFVSDSEAELFKQQAPECATRVWGIHNGVDTAYFDPARNYTAPFPLHEKPIVFTGAMDYWANVDAVTWFAREIFPAVRERDEEARFYIIGARPSSEVKELRRLPGVIVVGAVEDIRPYLAHAMLAVAPLRIARGVQNKVLEAMAMAKVVVVTPQALDGILCEPGRELLLAADAQAFSAQVVEVLATGADATLEQAARARVLAEYSWDINLQKFASLLEGEAGEAHAPRPTQAPSNFAKAAH